ncbi:MAG: hypothetical protein QM630_09645 [Microbacterium sp.]
MQAVRRIGTLEQRQAALHAGDIGETLQKHEIAFYEQFQDAGERFELIPRPPRAANGKRPSSNDFRATTLGEVEIKSFQRPNRATVSKEVARSIIAARDNHGDEKDRFIVYSRKYPPTPQFINQMRDYNAKHPNAQVRQLFWWDGANLIEIPQR